jgi:hypothetical protein
MSQIRTRRQTPGRSDATKNRTTPLKTTKGKRGRPRESTARHPDFDSEVWITVRLHRIRFRISTGKTPSIKEVCDKIAGRGGAISAVGGNIARLAEENLIRDKRWLRFEVDSTGDLTDILDQRDRDYCVTALRSRCVGRADVWGAGGR